MEKKSNMNYDKKHQLELLKLKHSQEKVFSFEEESELNKYSSMLAGQLDWETREEYLELFEKLINGKMNSFRFYLKFRERNEFNTLKDNY